MNLPKIALVSLRGVEGCGISAWERQFYAYCQSAGEVCGLYALDDRVGRPDTSNDLDVKLFSSAEYEDILSHLNSTYDLVLIMGVPSIKSKHASTYVKEFLEKIVVRKVMVNHDHHFMSINRNADFKAALECCDVVCTHSLKDEYKSGFKRWVNRKNINVSKWAKLYTFIHAELYKNITNTTLEGRLKKVTTFGRAVLWKRHMVLLNIANKLAERNFIVELLGFERSIAGWSQINLYKDSLNIFSTDSISKLVPNYTFFKEFYTMCPFQSAKHNGALLEFIEKDMPYQPSEYIYTMGSVEHFTGVRRLSKSAFAGHFRSFEHINLDYGNNQEYQGLEAMLLSVPIYHRHFLDTCTLPGTDIKLNTIPSFVSIDDDNRNIRLGGFQVINPDEFIDKLEAIWNNPKLYTQMRKDNVRIIQEYYSCEKLLPPFIEELWSI